MHLRRALPTRDLLRIKRIRRLRRGLILLRREVGPRASRGRRRAVRRARPVTGRQPTAPAIREARIPERTGAREALLPAGLLHRVIRQAPVRLLLARAGRLRIKAGRLPVRDAMFDMHCHLGFSKDGESIACRAAESLTAFSATVDLLSYEKDVRRFSSCSSVRVGLGLHPWFISDDDAQIERLRFSSGLSRLAQKGLKACSRGYAAAKGRVQTDLCLFMQYALWTR